MSFGSSSAGHSSCTDALTQRMTHFTPFEIGQIKAHVYHGMSGAAISRILCKRDGKSHWSETAVQDVVNKLEDEPSWRGERKTSRAVWS